jgi:predicted nucleotidyltransferase
MPRESAEAANERVRGLTDVLASAPEVRWAYLFGSAARGEPSADLDIAIMLSDAARGATALGRIAAQLEAAARDVPVDVIDLKSASPALAGRIAREGRLLVDREREPRLLWEVEANRIALDIQPWLDEFVRLRLQVLKERAG